MTVSVAIPVLAGSVGVHIEKGRQWSIVEHLLLHAVCRAPTSAADLAAASFLPERMVVEAMINLMRAGWVELSVVDGKTLFDGTAGGHSKVKGDELPAVTRLIRRRMRFVVDAVTGSVLRYRDLDFFFAARLPQRREKIDVILERNRNLPSPRQTDLIRSLLYDDERCRGFDMSSTRPGDGYVVATVTGDHIQGLPKDIPLPLREAVLEAAAKAPKAEGGPVKVAASPRASRLIMPERDVAFDAKDLVLGGPEHFELLKGVIGRARSRVVVHTTFLGDGRCDEVVGILARAARDYGVRCDILWGKTDEPDGENRTRAAGIAINDRMKSEQLDQFIKVHPLSTRSHAKLIVADDGQSGFQAVIGSCNWLSTPFEAFEASVRIVDPLLASDVMDVMAQMANAQTGLASGLASDLAAYAVNIRRQTISRSGRRAKARIVLAPEHAQLVRDARDYAESHILIGSHRLGRSAETLSMKPTRAAVAAKSVEATIYYGRVSAPQTVASASKITFDGAASGMRVRQISDPRMHAKFLAWDDADLVITSHNLLSADPSADFAEVGLHVKSTGLAREFRESVKRAFGY